jgi:type IV secretion system protein VirD4
MGYLKGEGVYVGGFWEPKKKIHYYLRHNGPEHVLCFAPTRSGKGVGLILPTLLAWEHSSLVLDIKGENFVRP